MSQNPILVERYRGDILESFHRGVICIVNEVGEVTFSAGDIQQECYPRSALKFFQAIPLVESGAAAHFGFTDEELAITCGSHNGEQEHVRVVQSILKKIGLDESYLQCGAQYPTLTEDKNELVRKEEEPKAIHNNCSGKHAGFLAYCVFKGLDLKNYIDPIHPLHVEIRRITAEMHEIESSRMHTGVDGCSAPIFSIPVYNQAIGFKNLVAPSKFSEGRQKACKRIVQVVLAHPYMIAGKYRYCTELMEACPDIIGKTGADGVYSIAFVNEKMGCSIKIDDGTMGPQYTVAEAVIEALGVCSTEKLSGLHHYVEHSIKNWNKLDTGINRFNKDILNAEF